MTDSTTQAHVWRRKGDPEPQTIFCLAWDEEWGCWRMSSGEEVLGTPGMIWAELPSDPPRELLALSARYRAEVSS